MVYALLTVMNSAIIDLCLLKEKDTLVDKLDSMYVRDELTKLYNRFGMRRFVEKIMKVAKRDNKFIMCIELDLDGLKKINDTYGHDAGDNAIVQVANAMRQASERRGVMQLRILCTSGSRGAVSGGNGNRGRQAFISGKSTQKNNTDIIKEICHFPDEKKTEI